MKAIFLAINENDAEPPIQLESLDGGTSVGVVTGLHSSTTFSEESCSVDVSEKIGFQLRSKLFATDVR